MPKPDTEEECEECKLAVGAGMALQLCKSLKKTDLDCDKELAALKKGKITTFELIKKIKGAALKEGNKLVAKRLNDLVKIIKKGKKG